MDQYNHKEIEKKWQNKWEQDGLHNVEDNVSGKENFYQLVEFSYPSGNLHVGHWYAFAVPDIFARYKKMQGYNVLYPIGFDAFGLPAENAAIKLGADPKVWTYEQMERMRVQLRTMGAIFPWDKEVVTCDSEYYKWTQWMFNQFLKNDLVYRAVTKVNWCPNDKTVLANEQVIDGKCDRCGTEVEQKNQEQWMLRITKYADRLIDDLDKLAWPEEIKSAQKNWIGRSEGSEISFKIKDSAQKIDVFTTRADTLFGVTYVVLAPEHELVSSLKLQVSSDDNKEEIDEYIESTKKKSELDRQQEKVKTGVELKGIKAINPANGEEVPVWIADYVLAGYGTGVVMAVPAHDERDFEFANKYVLPIKTVIREVADTKFLLVNRSLVDDWRNILSIYSWKPREDWAVEVLIKDSEVNNFIVIAQNVMKDGAYYFSTRGSTKLVGYKDKIFDIFIPGNDDRAKEYGRKLGIIEKELNWSRSFIDFGILCNSDKFNGLTSEEARVKITEFVGGKMVNTYRLRDWGISRQRYWGCPIPIVYDPEGKAHPVPDEHLPWILPIDVDHTPDGTAPLARSKELLERTEKIFGKGWRPEVETMDTFVDSSWYFYRYLDNKNGEVFADAEKMKNWMPINLYMGGAEHTTMHLLYSRFWVKALYDLGLVPQDEAYVDRRNRGLILGPDGSKMSKSKGNVVNPDEIVERLGADTVRLYLAFMGPYGVTTNYPWDPNGVVGVRRFLERVWRLAEKVSDSATTNKDLENLLHKTIKGITEDIEKFKFNTAISKMMVFLNGCDLYLLGDDKINKKDFRLFLQMLAPFAPHISDELWSKFFNEDKSIHLSTWPEFNEEKVRPDFVIIAIQINGKLRGQIIVPLDTSESDIEAQVKVEESVIKYITSEPKKVIHVKNKLINFVV